MVICDVYIAEHSGTSAVGEIMVYEYACMHTGNTTHSVSMKYCMAHKVYQKWDIDQRTPPGTGLGS